MTGASGQQRDDRGYEEQPQDGYGYDQQGYSGQAYGAERQNGQTYRVHADNGQAQDGEWYENQAYGAEGFGQYGGQAYDGPAYGRQSYEAEGYGPQGYENQGYGPQGHRAQGYGYADQPTRQYEGYEGYEDQPSRQYGGYGGEPGWADGYRDPRGGQGNGYNSPRYDSQGYAGYNGYQQQEGYAGPEYGAAPGRPDKGQGQGQGPGQRKVHFRRLRRFARRRSVRVAAAIFGVFLVWVMFSAGQAAFKNNGQGFTANLAEWARDHYLGPVVTFGEWLSYNPPKVGGKPSFSYAVPKGEQVTPAKSKHKGFVPDIPPTVKTLAAGAPLPGEGQWRVVEKVKGEPAILITFLRDGGQYTSYSNGIASIDQRLVKFSLRPGTEDPGPAPGDGGNWGVSDYIAPGQRNGVLATFNGGFKLDSAGGGFYLNGMYHGSLVKGAASIVYYKNGTIKIGEWGRDFTMNSSIEGVRQNLELLVDHGKLSPDANSAVKTGNWGATLGGGYWVWRSGIGITKDGRVVFVYGQALDAQDLGELLKQAGAVEGMQMDINPEWMKFDYYQANGHPSDPTPVPLLPTQQASPYSYYTPSTRDFTAVYAR
jgi:Phosphodiester glycosidase